MDGHWFLCNLFWLVWQVTWLLLAVNAWRDSPLLCGFVLLFTGCLAWQTYSMGRRRRLSRFKRWRPRSALAC